MIQCFATGRPRQNRNKDSIAKLFIRRALTNPKGTLLFAWRKVLSPGPARGVPSNDCSPASSPSARGQPSSTQSMPSGAGQTGPPLAAKLYLPASFTVSLFAVDGFTFKTLRGPGESYSEVILALAKG